MALVMFMLQDGAETVADMRIMSRLNTLPKYKASYDLVRLYGLFQSFYVDLA